MEIKERLTKCNFWDGNGSGEAKTNEYIVIHYVGAVSTAENNARYFENEFRGASSNYFVDENEIYRVVKDSDTAWHCGTTGAYKHDKCRNTNSIGIEMCCFNNNGVLDVSDKVIERTIELTKELMAKYGITEDRVIRHYDVTGKNCPAPFISNPNRWVDFKSKLVEKPKSTITYLNLNSNITEWRVYPMGVAPVVGNECKKLLPSKFGGLSYTIKGYSQENVAIISTRDFGDVQIFIGKGTEGKYSITDAPIYGLVK